MANLKDILTAHPNDEVLLDCLVDLYPNQAVSRDLYRQLLATLRELPPSPSDCVVDVYVDEIGVVVDGLHSGDPTRYALDFCSFGEWLGFTVSDHAKKHFADVEILVRCLWEMTFNGFTDQAIANKRNELLERISNLES